MSSSWVHVLLVGCPKVESHCWYGLECFTSVICKGPRCRMSAHVLTKRSLYKSDIVVDDDVSALGSRERQFQWLFNVSRVGRRRLVRGTAAAAGGRRTIIIPSDSLYLDRQISDRISFALAFLFCTPLLMNLLLLSSKMQTWLPGWKLGNLTIISGWIANILAEINPIDYSDILTLWSDNLSLGLSVSVHSLPSFLRGIIGGYNNANVRSLPSLSLFEVGFYFSVSMPPPSPKESTLQFVPSSFPVWLLCEASSTQDLVRHVSTLQYIEYKYCSKYL